VCELLYVKRFEVTKLYYICSVIRHVAKLLGHKFSCGFHLVAYACLALLPSTRFGYSAAGALSDSTCA
jgi:hypothetical protein